MLAAAEANTPLLLLPSGTWIFNVSTVSSRQSHFHLYRRQDFSRARVTDTQNKCKILRVCFAGQLAAADSQGPKPLARHPG